MKPNLVPKYNLFGNSAVEIGTLASKMDLEIDKIRPGNTMSFYMVDDSDSIFNLKINFGNLKARIRFMLKYQVKYLYHSGERSAAWKMCIIFFMHMEYENTRIFFFNLMNTLIDPCWKIWEILKLSVDFLNPKIVTLYKRLKLKLFLIFLYRMMCMNWPNKKEIIFAI